MTVYLLKEWCGGRHTQSFLSVITASGSTIAASTIVWLVMMGSSCITVLVRSSHHIVDGESAEGMLLLLLLLSTPLHQRAASRVQHPKSCGSQQSLPPGGKERLHFVGIRPEVQARKGGW